MEPAYFTDEKFALYRDYQLNIHGEQQDDPASFSDFLCDPCLLVSSKPSSHQLSIFLMPAPKVSSIPYSSIPAPHLPQDYGTYHHMYRVDGELVAMSVLDILSNCVVSKYFVHLGKWSWCSLGKVHLLFLHAQEFIRSAIS